MTESRDTSDKAKTDETKVAVSRSRVLRFSSHTLFIMNVLTVVLLTPAVLLGKYALQQAETHLDYELSGISSAFMATPIWAMIVGSIVLGIVLTAKEIMIKNRVVTLLIEVFFCVVCSVMILGIAVIVIIVPIFAAMAEGD